MSRPTTAVVVCAYTTERWGDLNAALSSAAGQQPAPDELLLVVDHNDILLARAQRELVPVLPGLRVISSRRKQGLSGARNTALEEVRSEVVVFLDDDADAEPGWLAALTAPYADSSVIAVGGVAKPVWPDEEPRPVTLPSNDSWTSVSENDWSVRGELDWIVGCTYAGQPLVASTVRNLMGCNMSMRRSVFAAVGGFSEHLGRVGRTPLGCEETELCIRAQAAEPGSKIVFVPQARVRHHVSRDRLTWRYLWHRSYAEGLSKAAVASLVGSSAALASERRYATDILPRGVLRCIAGTVRGPSRRIHALGAVAIVTGLSVTTLGYLRGKAARPDLSSAVSGTALAAARPAGVESVGAHAPASAK